jgi:hypothetical protein
LLKGDVDGALWLRVRIASGVISVIQTVQVEGSIPVIGGVAVSAQPLGWADVVDNLLNHISTVCLWAMGAISMQKILLAISVWASLRIVVPLCAVLIVAALWNKRYAGRLKRVIGGIIIIFAGISGAIPLSLELSNVVERNILSAKINETLRNVNDASDRLEEFGSGLDDASFIDTLRRLGAGVANFFAGIKNYFDNLINNVIDYIFVFIVTNIIIPIATLFGLRYLVAAALKYIGFSLAAPAPASPASGLKNINDAD